MTMGDYAWPSPRAGKTLAQLELRSRHRIMLRELRSCLWIPFLWVVGIVVPAALTFAFGTLWVLVLYAVVMGVIGTAYWQGKR